MNNSKKIFEMTLIVNLKLFLQFFRLGVGPFLNKLTLSC